MSKTNAITTILNAIPERTGVYEYYDKNQNLIYVGKAKNLKRRISSYFIKNQQNKKTKLLVSKIQDIKYLIVDTEMDALLLENNLIKRHQPKYNVLLKDGKTYPWICIKNEPFPRVFQTRSIVNDGSEYFGPYTSVRLVRLILDFFIQLYPTRNCNLRLTKKNIAKKKFSVCLEYHIKNCLGPCVGKQNTKNYLLGIDHFRKILNGDTRSVIRHLTKKMAAFSKNLEYEAAQITKEKIALVKNYQSKSTIVSHTITDVDVFTIASNQTSAFVNFLKIKGGGIVQGHTLEINKKLNESERELLELAIVEMRRRFNSQSKTIYCSIYLKNLWEGVTVIVPKIGEKKKLLDLSFQNAKHLLLEKETKKTHDIDRKNKIRILTSLKNDLRLQELPRHIECFDNSNTQGTNPVAACVVFKNGRPKKKEYRHFNIKSVRGPNDFASMQEVVYRRFKRILNQGADLPQLIIIDGGKGQLNSAVKSLARLGLKGKIAVVGIAKRLEEIYFPNDMVPLFLDKRSESLKLIQQLRNEAHRFGIKHHRSKRNKTYLTSSLEHINGIGPKTVSLLITYFGSVKRIKSAKKTELIQLIGKSRAEKIVNSFL